ncbi:MAG TPA: hypothetical protein VI461_13995, partial [Chitinophagaceae bacterium]|nr:hypothetical protein [Chitinophagaceae bacterium]
MKQIFCFSAICFLVSLFASGQQKGNDVTTPLHALQPDYPVPYIIPSQANVKLVIDKVFHYLDSVTPPQFINRVSKAAVVNTNDPDTNIIFKPGDFRLTSYE